MEAIKIFGFITILAKNVHSNLSAKLFLCYFVRPILENDILIWDSQGVTFNYTFALVLNNFLVNSILIKVEFINIVFIIGKYG
jgi:hypothetical protein